MNAALDARRIMMYINARDRFLIVSEILATRRERGRRRALHWLVLAKRTDLLSSEMFLMNRDVFGGRMYLAMIKKQQSLAPQTLRETRNARRPQSW